MWLTRITGLANLVQATALRASSLEIRAPLALQATNSIRSIILASKPVLWGQQKTQMESAIFVLPTAKPAPVLPIHVPLAMAHNF